MTFKNFFCIVSDSGAHFGHILGQAISGEHDLAPGVQNVLDRVEELELGRGLAFEELHVLHHEELMASPVAMLELGGAIASQGREELVGEIL